MQLSTTSLIILLTGASCVLQATCSICPYNTTLCRCHHDFISCTGLQSMPRLYTGPEVMNVTVIDIQTGNITSIPNGSLPPGLEALAISRNPVTEIADDVFINSATTLTELDLSGLKLRQLPYALLRLTNLSALDIENTPIGILQEDVLQNITMTLTYLRLENVSLLAWPRAISYLRFLTGLNLNGNSLKIFHRTLSFRLIHYET
ncbi:unnamed protein product [Candidula unifasciata]|uniref:LRRNT domain-containing protein n=1 Tax=Candidula unifasciata TaxID=100452 RepID=A0A8S3ZJA6_9EUPU|nr:unnamed protein product [Candidula unifasciata]